MLLQSFSLGSTKWAKQKLKCTSTPLLRKTLGLDKISMASGKPTELSKQLIDFLENNQNSAVVPDETKSKKGLRCHPFY